MQSGRANSQRWLLEYDSMAPRQIDPLMGWTSSADTTQQVVMAFATKEEAVEFAKARGLEFEVGEPRDRRVRPKSYADNFKSGQVG